MSIFRAYDVRGVYPEEINENLAKKIARTYAQIRQKELGRQELTLVVAHDMRLSSPSLYEAVKHGLLAEGVTVVEIGLTATPVFYFTVAKYGYDGGLMISASHNPPQYNGIKIVRDKALPFGEGSGMEELAELVAQENFEIGTKEGKIIKKSDIMKEYLAQELLDIKINHGRSKKIKIVADAANGMGSVYLRTMFDSMSNTELVEMNFVLDGSFPAHEADPSKDENIKDLQKKVVDEKADVGIATDGDGDRVFFVDEIGERIGMSVVLAILSKLFLQDFPGAKICYDIRPGKITPETIVANGGEAILSKSGNSFIKRKMIEDDASFGGELSGHIFLKFPYGIYEAPVWAIAKFIIALQESGQTLSEFTKPFRKYIHSGEINFPVSNKEAVWQKLKIKYADAELNELDGLSFSYPEVWFNIRGSNTEPLIRLNVEGLTKYNVQKIVEEVREMVG
jgi:phosphomannomutase